MKWLASIVTSGLISAARLGGRSASIIVAFPLQIPVANEC